MSVEVLLLPLGLLLVVVVHPVVHSWTPLSSPYRLPETSCRRLTPFPGVGTEGQSRCRDQ